MPEGLIAETIPRQTYAVFTHTMKTHSLHEELQPTIAWIWGTSVGMVVPITTEEREFAMANSTEELFRRMAEAGIEPLVDRQPTPRWLG